jgi:hypothetical protein
MYPADAELFSEPLIDYLMARDWMLMESEPDIAVLRKMIRNQEEEIVLPRDRTYVDYHQRILEALRFLAQYEQSTILEIKEELLSQKWDMLRIRIKGAQIGNGYISYADKICIEEGLRKVLLASARCVLEPKPYYKRLYSIPAEQWMKRCRAKADQSGSYILTVQLPLDKNIDDLEIPLSRRVAEYLMTSLNQLVFLSEQSDSFVEIEEALLNANLCLGVAEMKPDENPIDFNFEMKWSSEIPIKTSIPTKIEILDHHFPSIINIGQRLKPQTEITQNIFVGKVQSLHGEADEQGNMLGEATLILFRDEEQTKAKVFFGSEYYSMACDAHKQNRYIRISGSLFEKPRYSDLKNISCFEMI